MDVGNIRKFALRVTQNLTYIYYIHTSYLYIIQVPYYNGLMPFVVGPFQNYILTGHGCAKCLGQQRCDLSAVM